jgi:hypothetical protein
MPTRKPKPSPKPKVVLPSMRPPPGWFMPRWLDPASWSWDGQRRCFALRLEHHAVQIVARRGVDWTWRVTRLESGLVSMDFGFRTAQEARRNILGVFWSDLWDGGAQHERWRNGNTQRWLERDTASSVAALHCHASLIATRVDWAAAVEDEKLAASG